VHFDDMPSSGAVAFRPHARQFLEAAAQSFELVVFTASQKSYADKVINALDPTGTLIEHRLYRQHCTECRGAFFKELGLMGRPLKQCILIDNSPISCACNTDNSVLIRSWYGCQKDQELLDLLAVFQDMQLQAQRCGSIDCGRYLARRYGLRDFFEGLRETAGHAVHLMPR
jgi:Dullard-like phosphatase family protein